MVVIKPRSFFTLLKLWCKFQFYPYIVWWQDGNLNINMKAYWVKESAYRFARKTRSKNKINVCVFYGISVKELDNRYDPFCYDPFYDWRVYKKYFRYYDEDCE